jgi:hypothetical protein
MLLAAVWAAALSSICERLRSIRAIIGSKANLGSRQSTSVYVDEHSGCYFT